MRQAFLLTHQLYRATILLLLWYLVLGNRRETQMQIPSLRVDGKVALITGAGTGLGQASAVALAQAGANVALTELPGKEGLAQQTVELVEATGRRAMAVPLDVTRLPMIAEAVDQTLTRFGRIDIL